MRDYYFNSNVNSTNVRLKKIQQRATYGVLSGLWTLAPGWTQWITMRLFFSPRRYRTKVREEAILATGDPFQFRVHDKTIQGWSWGAGPAMLLVHGWNGRGIQFHRFIEPLVAAGYTALAIDGPAHGASTGRITSYFEFTDTVRVLLADQRRFKIEGIIAHSFGAAAAINALTKEKMALHTVCIAPILKLRELLHNAFDQFGIPRRLYGTLVKEFESRFGYQLAEDNPHRLVKDLPGNILIVHDSEDRTAPYGDSQQAARQYDHVALWSSNGLGHSGVLRSPEVIERCVAHLVSKTDDSEDQQLDQEAS